MNTLNIFLSYLSGNVTLLTTCVDNNIIITFLPIATVTEFVTEIVTKIVTEIVTKLLQILYYYCIVLVLVGNACQAIYLSSRLISDDL